MIWLVCTIEPSITGRMFSCHGISSYWTLSRSYQVLVTLMSRSRSQGPYYDLACLHHRAINYRSNVFISWDILILDIISVVSSFGDLDVKVKVTGSIL